MFPGFQKPGCPQNASIMVRMRLRGGAGPVEFLSNYHFFDKEQNNVAILPPGQSGVKNPGAMSVQKNSDI